MSGAWRAGVFLDVSPLALLEQENGTGYISEMLRVKHHPTCGFVAETSRSRLIVLPQNLPTASEGDRPICSIGVEFPRFFTHSSNYARRGRRKEEEVTNSKDLAELIGPTLLAISITEAINLPIFVNNPAPVVYLNGTLLFVAGLSIVRVHNRWMRDWPVLITFVGWLFLLGGLIRMVAPEFAQRSVQDPTPVYALLLVLLAIGIVLTFKAYATDHETAG